MRAAGTGIPARIPDPDISVLRPLRGMFALRPLRSTSVLHPGIIALLRERTGVDAGLFLKMTGVPLP